MDAQQALEELAEDLGDIYDDKFSAVEDDFDNQLSLLEHLTNTYDEGMNYLDEKGYMATTKFYDAERKVTEQSIELMKQEIEDLTQEMSDAVNSGTVAEGSDAWYDWQQSINDVKESLQEANTELVELNNNIRETEWDRFDYIEDTISNITDEADFLIDLMENKDMFDDNGKMTDYGQATMGLHAQNYDVYMAQANDYAEEIKKINEELAEDPYNTKLLDRRQELLESQRDMIQSAEDEKEAIKDLVEDGIDAELDAMKDLIDSYEDSLDSESDLYDYQKKVKEQADEVASLQKQIAAYSGDTSEENKATVQKIQVDLKEAMEDLEETENDRMISEQKEMLDNLYDEYETILNKRLDDVDALLSEAIAMSNENSANICDTLEGTADKVGYSLTSDTESIWANGGYATSILATYGTNFSDKLTSVNETLSGIRKYVATMAGVSDEEAASTISSTTSTTETIAPPEPEVVPEPEPEPVVVQTPSRPSFNSDIQRGIACSIWTYGDAAGWGNGSTRIANIDSKFGSGTGQQVQDYINAHYLDGSLVDFGSTAYFISQFKKGGLADYTGLAWLDGTKQNPETVLNASDTENFFALRDAMESVANGSSPLAALFGGSGDDIVDKLSDVISPDATPQTTIGDITYEINIPIDHVDDYNDFMNQMSKDDKFQKFIQSVTIDRLAGGSKIAKNKYKW